MTTFALICLALIALKLAFEIGLERLNQRQVRLHAGSIPEAYSDIMDPPSYERAVQYTLAKSRFSEQQTIYNTSLLGLLLFTGACALGYERITQAWGESAWVQALFIVGVGWLLSVANLPFTWFDQFSLEARFGFNTTTPKLWWSDRFKSFLLSGVLGFSLLLLVLKTIEWIGAGWWLCAWGCVVGFQFLMMIVAPVWILPLFNKFTPLPEGDLRQRLIGLAHRTDFRAHSVQVMDGSKRSLHSNAFFTGFGRFRRIVLFDTLIQQLNPAELESVLAHEIGHYKLRHLWKMFFGSAIGLLVAFYAIDWLATQAWFGQAFGFVSPPKAVSLLLFGLLSGLVVFWFSPLINLFSRRYEYEADAFARRTMNEAQSLMAALRKLAQKNLSNLTPHRLYSAFYYSHPTLIERERALKVSHPA